MDGRLTNLTYGWLKTVLGLHKHIGPLRSIILSRYMETEDMKKAEFFYYCAMIRWNMLSE